MYNMFLFLYETVKTKSINELDLFSNRVIHFWKTN